MTRTSKRRLLVVAAVAVAGAYFGGLLDSSASRQGRALGPLVARLDAEEPGWRVGEVDAAHNATLPPPERNAATQALAAHALVPDLTTAYWTGTEAFYDKPSRHLPDAKTLGELLAAHGKCTEALAVARRVRDLPTGGIPLTFAKPNPFATLLPNIQNLRNGATLLALDAAVLAHTGDAAGALDDCRAILNVAGGVGDEPTLISQLVRMAVAGIAVRETERALAWTAAPPADKLAELQARLLEERDVPRLVYGLRGERASLFQICESVGDGSLTLGALGAGPAAGSTADLIATRFVRGSFRRAQVQVLTRFEELMEAAKLPDPERDPAMAAVMASIPRAGTVPTAETLVGMVMPAAEKCGEAETRHRAKLGSMAAALACERFRLANGRFPAALAEIPPGMLKVIPADPYTGKPLLYRVLPDGIAVYSVGLDLADDGGTDLRAQMVKGGPPGGDIGVKLWNPDLRRAAPLPPEPVEGAGGE